MADQRLQMTLQLTNSLSWPFLTILVSWTSFLFFGFGITVRRNGTTIATLAVGAFAVASAVCLIVELSRPYSGLLRLHPDPLAQAIDALST
jgi:predicted benzoate:H+ symporter BenE